MFVPPLIDSFKSGSENRSQRLDVVADDWETAAFFWTVRRESSNDGGAPRTQGLLQAFDISPLIRGIGKEMEGGPIVPN